MRGETTIITFTGDKMTPPNAPEHPQQTEGEKIVKKWAWGASGIIDPKAPDELCVEVAAIVDLGSRIDSALAAARAEGAKLERERIRKVIERNICANTW